MFLKNLRGRAKMVVLIVIRLGFRSTERGSQFCFRIPRTTCITRDKCGFFKMSQRDRALRPSLRDGDAPNVQKLGTNSKKGWNLIFPQKNQPLYFDPKIGGNSNSASKHDPILSADQVMGVQS